MSFGLSVYAPDWPVDVAAVWQQSLSRYGLTVEVFPGFNAAEWKGGFLPFKLVVTPGSFPAAKRYGSDAVLAGFEVDFQSENPADQNAVREADGFDASPISAKDWDFVPFPGWPALGGSS